MPGIPRTIDAPIPGPANVQTFALDPGVAFDVEAVYIEIDTSGAGGPVTAELTILEQSGVVIAKKRQGSTVPAGGAGSATWALRLDDNDGSQAPTGPPEIPFCAVKFDVTVPAASVYPLAAGDLIFTVPNVYPDYYALDGATGGLTSLIDGLNRFDTIWSALIPGGGVVTPNPELLFVDLVGDTWLVPDMTGPGGFPTGPAGIGFKTWLNTGKAGIYDLYELRNTDPVNDMLVSGRANVWRLNSDAPE